MPDQKNLKNLYDAMLEQKPLTQKKQHFSFFVSFIQKCKMFFGFIKNNYLAVELTLFGIILLLLALMPAVHLFCNRFLEVVDKNYNFYSVAFWLFNSSTGESIVMSLFSMLIVLSGLGSLAFGIILLFVKMQKQFLASIIFHSSSFVFAFLFWLMFVIWVNRANNRSLQVLGFDTIYFNFSTMIISTYVFFLVSFILIAFTIVYLYHYRKQIFAK